MLLPLQVLQVRITMVVSKAFFTVGIGLLTFRFKTLPNKGGDVHGRYVSLYRACIIGRVVAAGVLVQAEVWLLVWIERR